MEFKRHTLLNTLGCMVISISLILAACGGDSGSNSDDVDEDEEFEYSLSDLAEWGVSIIDEVSKLGKCSPEDEFKVVYVKTDHSFFVCSDGNWTDDFSVTIPTVESEKDLGECNEENDGQVLRISRDSIYETFSCEGGEWVSDIGGASAEPVDPKTVVKGSFKDERDGKTYKTVTIGKQTWMAENLNYKTSNSYCYNDKEENCKTYGRMYSTMDVAKACPSGWKIPSLAAWETLRNSTGNTIFQNAISKEDPYGLNFLMGGMMVAGEYNNIGNNAVYWTGSFRLDINQSSLRILTKLGGTTAPGNGMAAYIRCIKK